MKHIVKLEDLVRKVTWQRQPVSLVVLVILLLSLTACSESSITHPQSVPSFTNPDTSVSQDAEVDTSLLENFVNAINNHQVNEALDLFNDAAFITEFSQV